MGRARPTTGQVSHNDGCHQPALSVALFDWGGGVRAGGVKRQGVGLDSRGVEAAMPHPP